MGGLQQGISAALVFVAPLAVLLVLREAVVRSFDVNPRVFPPLGAVAQAALDIEKKTVQRVVPPASM